MNSTKNLMAGLLGVGALLMAGDASAARVWTKKLAPGIGGPAPQITAEGLVLPQKNATPASEQGVFEHAVITLPPEAGQTVGRKAVDIMTVWMSGAVPNNDRPNQCKLSVVRITETGAPIQIVEPIQISGSGAAAIAGGPQPRANNNADRPCNHPAISRLDVPGLPTDQAAFVIARGTDSYNTNVQTRARVFDNKGAVLSTAGNGGGWQLLSNNNNNNIGAAETRAIRPGQFTVFVNNNSDTGDGYMVETAVSQAAPRSRMVTIERTDVQTFVDPGNIVRPMPLQLANGYQFMAGTRSNNRPPEIGLDVATFRENNGQFVIMDGRDVNNNGTLDRSRLLVASQPNAPTREQRKYVQASYVQAGKVAPADGMLNSATLSYWVSNGGGNDGNNRQGGNRGQRPARGVTKQYVQSVDISETGRVSLAGSPMLVTAVNGTHITTCSGQYGPAPTAGGLDPLEMAFLDLSITGAGVPTLGFAQKDPTGAWRQLSNDTKAVSSALGDSGYLANLLGQDPNRSGRDFAQCKGDIPNPGAMNPDNFRPNVDSFFVATYSGKDTSVETEKKNAQWLTLVPGRLNNWTLPQAAAATTSGAAAAAAAVTTGAGAGAGAAAGTTTGGGAQCITGRENCPAFPSGDCYDGLRANAQGICVRSDGNGAGAGNGSGNGQAAAAAAATTTGAGVTTGGTTTGGAAAANNAAVTTGGNGAAAANNNAATGGGGEEGGSDGGCSSSETGRSGLSFMLLALIGLIIRRRS